jgi:fatty acid synthase
VGFADMNATANADEMRARGLEPDEFSRANDVRRRGFVEAQGGGTMLLARADVALRLGLPVRAVVGYAASFSDGIQKSIPAPGLGAIACVLGKERSPLALSLARFGLTTDDIAMVYKHDTSTQANDPNENRLHDAIQRYLGRAEGNPLWVVSQKTITGHAKGGSAAWQAIGLAQALAQGVIPGNRNLDAVDPAMAAFEHMAFTDAAIDAGADVLEAGLLTSLGFGHVSGIILLLHPRHFLAQVPHAERAAYLSSVAAREARERQGLVEAMIGRAPLYERRAARRFEGADGSEQQHAEEIALLTELTGRYDLEAGRFTTEEPG